MHVELALYTRVPGRESRVPPRSGTFAASEEYKRFVERVSKEADKPVSVDQLEDEKPKHEIAPLVLDMNTRNDEPPSRPRASKSHAPKEDVKYVIRKNPRHKKKEPEEDPNADFVPEPPPTQPPRGKHYYKKPYAQGIVYRPKKVAQPASDTK